MWVDAVSCGQLGVLKHVDLGADGVDASQLVVAVDLVVVEQEDHDDDVGWQGGVVGAGRGDCRRACSHPTGPLQLLGGEGSWGALRRVAVPLRETWVCRGPWLLLALS